MASVTIRPEILEGLSSATDAELIAYVSDTFGLPEEELYRLLQIQKVNTDRITVDEYLETFVIRDRFLWMSPPASDDD